MLLREFHSGSAVLEHYERTTQLNDRVDRSVSRALGSYRDTLIVPLTMDTPTARETNPIRSRETFPNLANPFPIGSSPSP